MKFNWKWIIGICATIVLALPFIACHSQCHAATNIVAKCDNSTPHNCE